MVGLAEGDATRRALAFVVSAGYFDTFGRPPAMGRAFSRDEEQPGADIPLAIVSHDGRGQILNRCFFRDLTPTVPNAPVSRNVQSWAPK